MRSEPVVTARKDFSPRFFAWTAGAGLLLMAVLAPIAQFGILQKLFAGDDVDALLLRLVEGTKALRIAVALLFIVAVLDVLVAWALHGLFRPYDRFLSLLAAWSRLAYAVLFFASLGFLWGATDLLRWTGSATELGGQVAFGVALFRAGWTLALIVFGVHLAVLALLVLRSGFLPKWLGFLLGLSALGYAFDGFHKLLVPGAAFELAAFTFVGEVVLIVFLFLHGAKKPA